MSRMTTFMRLVSPSRMKAPPLTPFCSRSTPAISRLRKRLAQHVAADAELLGEIALRRQLVARLEDAERELLADALADLLERAPRVDRPKARRRRRAGRTVIGGAIAPVEATAAAGGRASGGLTWSSCGDY